MEHKWRILQTLLIWLERFASVLCRDMAPGSQCLKSHRARSCSCPPPGESDTGSIIGPIIDLIGGIVRGRVPSLPMLPPAPPGALPPLPQNGRSGPGFTLGGAIPASNGCATNQCCRGQHPNKSRSCDGSPPGSKCVSNRRMNSLNQPALRRATRRLKGFERAVKNTRKQLRSLAKI